MTLLRPASFILLLLAASAPTQKTFANPCNPIDLLGTILGTKDSINEGLAKRFQYQDIKNFDADLYIKNKEEFDKLNAIHELPKEPPPKTEFERHLAWLDTQTETGKKLPTILNILEEGTAQQKVRLSEWVDRYGEKKLTNHQIQEAATELSLILHNTKFTVSELYRHGAHELAKKMIASQYHEHLIHEQLKFIFQESDLLKRENLLQTFKRIKESNPGKWIFMGGGNAYSFTKVKDWGGFLMIKLPKHQFAKLSMEDLKTLLKEGLDSTKFEEIAKNYTGIIKGQVLYNSLQSVISAVSKYLFVDFAFNRYQGYQKRKADLKAKDQS